MFTYEKFTKGSNYVDQLKQLDPALEEFATSLDPKPDVVRDAEKTWAKSSTPIVIDTAARVKRPISNLEALPFRTLLENLDMPFEDDILYTANDITDSIDLDKFLANTLANVYQLGNLSDSIFMSFQYLKMLPTDVMNKFSEDVQSFITNLSKSSEPFELMSLPNDQIQEGLDLLNAIADNQPTTSSAIVLHPLSDRMTVVFINASNIQSMSTKQVAQRLKELGKIRKAISRVSIKKLVDSPSIDRSHQASQNYDRQSNDVARSARVSSAKMKKLNSSKKIAKIIQRQLQKSQVIRKSNNFTKIQKKTYNKPNRREPENPFKAGKTSKKKYLPNLHLYLDTSGSMSIDRYKTGILAAISIAKELKTDIYISSFSTHLTQPILLDRIRSQSPNQLLKRALKIPVIQGGTDFVPVYEDISLRVKTALQNKNTPELAIICSDMEFSFGAGYQTPKEANSVLHLCVSESYGPEYFVTSAYNAGITNIDNIIYQI